MYKWILAAALASVCAVPAFAGQQDRFAAMDTDKNGQVSWDEFHTALPNMKKPAFDQIDADKNGAINAEEWGSFRSAHGSGGMGAAGMGGAMPPAGMPGGTPEAMPRIQPPSGK